MSCIQNFNVHWKSWRILRSNVSHGFPEVFNENSNIWEPIRNVYPSVNRRRFNFKEYMCQKGSLKKKNQHTSYDSLSFLATNVCTGGDDKRLLMRRRPKRLRKYFHSTCKVRDLDYEAVPRIMRTSHGYDEFMHDISINNSQIATADVMNEVKDISHVCDIMPEVLSGDTCIHCARKGFDMICRQANIHEQLDATNEHIRKSLKPFQSERRTACMFLISYTIFLHQSQEVSTDCLLSLPVKFAELAPRLPVGSRLRLRVNDHLRGEEGVRGWMLCIEGRSVDALLSAIECIAQYLPEYKVYENGSFDKSWL